MTDGFKAPPISGYTDQSEWNKTTVNMHKDLEEKLLRLMDEYMKLDSVDKRWCAISRTQMEQAFMALNRAIFKPQRIKLPEDTQ